MARERTITTVSPVRRKVLGSPSVTLRSTRRHRHEDKRLPWIFVVDVIGSTVGTASCVARLRYWRGNLIAAEVLDGSAEALPAPVVERLAELRQIRAVVAQAQQGVSHGG